MKDWRLSCSFEQQLEDMPYDSKDPLFEFGFGLRYAEGLFLEEEDGE